jgi:hypothetical protein
MPPARAAVHFLLGHRGFYVYCFLTPAPALFQLIIFILVKLNGDTSRENGRALNKTEHLARDGLTIVPFVPWHGAPRFRGPPATPKKFGSRGAHGSGPGIYLPPFWGGKQKKKRSSPPVHKSWKIPWSGPPRSFGMGPPNVLIRACISLVRGQKRRLRLKL